MTRAETRKKIEYENENENEYMKTGQVTVLNVKMTMNRTSYT